ncbi:MAG: response regulator [Proteobacteria bacterium]|nr:response regulator [Pseudomonadota bacterium]MBU1596734.1 response regulator [Pseudomonadota bacterium]
MSPAGLNILLVEDERVISLAMELLIRKLGHRVGASVSSGEEALAVLDSVRPDLVLMDIHLQGELDGIETARQIRGLGGPPLAFVTAYTDPETQARALATDPLAFPVQAHKPGGHPRPGAPGADAWRLRGCHVRRRPAAGMFHCSTTAEPAGGGA